jgi:hypothetical protein
METKSASIRAMACVALTAAVMASAITSAVSLPFSDTGSGPFAAQIDRITDAGCASGFPDGSFRPRDDVRRQQFAYWVDNCAARIAHTSGTAGIVFDTEEEIALADTITTAGASGRGQTQFVRIEGIARVGSLNVAYDDFCSSTIRCTIKVMLYRDGDLLATQHGQWASPTSASAFVSVPVEAVISVPTDTTVNYSLRVQGSSNVEANTAYVFDRTLTATVFPMGRISLQAPS